MLQKHVQLLYNRAAEFCRHARPCPIDYLHRNKSSDYFEKIISGDGWMNKYLKNDGGDQASPLNRSIQGLFFSGYYKYSPEGRQYLPKTSPFGDQRLHVVLPFFVNPKNKLYFADFFCHVVNHHVTLVVTKAGSDSDHFSRQHLIPLDIMNNPFLYFRENTYYINAALNIEVFYTENINIKKLEYSNQAYFSFCRVKGNSKFKSFIGHKKNEACPTCNLTFAETMEPVLR